MSSKSCPRCQKRKFYRVRRGKLRCKNCLYEFKPRLGGLGLSRADWKKIIFWFVLDQPILAIKEQTGLSQYSVFKAVNLLRKLMIKDVPEVFSGTVEVDETYLGGQKKNKRKSQLRKEKEILGKESKRGLGTTKQAVFGILARSGKVFARLVENTEAKDLIPIIERKVEAGSQICSDTWRAYTGLATRGYVHRTVEHAKKEYAIAKNHINGLEGFFGYLKRKLAAKGGVRREYLALFLSEYVWRYNCRQMAVKQKTDRLFKLLEDFSG
jgi:transposase-like protein